MKKKRRSTGHSSYQGQNNQDKFQPLRANVKVVGIGGAGGNMVSRMSRDFTRGVDFIAINTDHQDLDQCPVRRKLYIGKSLTKGLGTGMNPELGRQAAEENRSEIAEAVQGADLVFLAAGLGGGTGSSATPIVAEAAKQSGALTIAVVTKPFSFEGAQRERIAAEALMKLKDKVDAIIVVPNDRIFTVISKDTPVIKAFEAIDDVLRRALRGIVDIIAQPGLINIDFADVKNIMQDAGVAIVGVGVASGQERAVNAVSLALHSPLLETSPEGAKAVLLGISGGRDLKMTEINEAAKVISQTADPGARIIFGAYYDRNLKPGQIKVTVVAAGFNGNQTGSLFGGPGVHMTTHGVTGNFGEHERERLASDRLGGDRLSGGGERQNIFAVRSTPTTIAPDYDAHSPAKFTEAKKEKEIPKNPKGMNPANTSSNDKDKDGKESDPWDIPAFLRRRKK